ncbi:MAG: hypothetical protein QW667_02670 [Candidatus Bathyarchaeia archaeon]
MAQYVVGVKSGDWIKYNLSMTGQGENVQGWIKITIESVSGTVIQGKYVGGVGGQQTPEESFTLDVAFGSGGMNGFIIPANLTVGQNIPGEATTVQGVTTRHGRTAVYASATDPYSGGTGQVYWDQATGVLLEVTASYGGYEYKLTIAETNMWGGGFFGAGLGLDWWIWMIIIIGIIVVITAIALILHRRKPPPPSMQLPPPPPPPPPPP